MAETKAKEAHVWKRDDLDHYVEPQRCTAQLLARERFVGGIHDPACGFGNIVKACHAAGYQATGSDLVDRTDGAPWFSWRHDFLALGEMQARISSIICNPPYYGGKGTEAFIRRALVVATHKVAIFVDRRFLTGQGRARGLYREHPPTRIWEITPRPSCPPGEYLAAGNVAGGGSADYSWLVWSLTEPSGPTAHGWLTVDDLPKPVA